MCEEASQQAPLIWREVERGDSLLGVEVSENGQRVSPTATMSTGPINRWRSLAC